MVEDQLNRMANCYETKRQERIGRLKNIMPAEEYFPFGNDFPSSIWWISNDLVSTGKRGEIVSISKGKKYYRCCLVL
jgi:hypothetical protein